MHKKKQKKQDNNMMYKNELMSLSIKRFHNYWHYAEI